MASGLNNLRHIIHFACIGTWQQVLEDGTWLASEADVHAISLGCAILGCGGGGSPHLASLKLLREMARCDLASGGPKP